MTSLTPLINSQTTQHLYLSRPTLSSPNTQSWYRGLNGFNQAPGHSGVEDLVGIHFPALLLLMLSVRTIDRRFK